MEWAWSIDVDLARSVDDTKYAVVGTCHICGFSSDALTGDDLLPLVDEVALDVRGHSCSLEAS